MQNAVTGISLSEKLIDLGLGYKKQITAKVTPDDATDKSVKWTSDNPEIATVADDGTITGKSYGRTVVTAKTVDGEFTAKCVVRVKPIDVIDATGENSFVSSNTDSETTFTGSANSASISQKSASVGAEAHKDFEVYDSGKVELEYRLTTGGVKIDGSNWNWTGHEYTMGMKLADSDGNNIVTIYQPYTTKAQSLMSQTLLDSNATAVTASGSGWSNSGNVAGNIQGSSKRWKVKVTFDYDNDNCTVKVTGTDGNWENDDGVMQKTFALNGAKFKTLSLYTQKDEASATLTASPKIENLSYSKSTTVSGVAEELYNKGGNGTFTDSDIADWSQTGTDTAALAVDSDNNRILYNPTQPGTEYSAEKTFEVKDNAIVTYDVDWYFGSAVGRDGNFEYLQIGNIRLGWTNGYKMFLSTDGGSTWLDSDGDGTNDSVFDGANQTYTKNVKVIVNTAIGVASLWFDETKIGDYTVESVSNSVKFGFTRAGAAPNWAVPNGIDRIKVSQFVPGEEPLEFTEVKAEVEDDKNVAVTYAVVDEDVENITLIGVLYDTDGKLLEIKTVSVDNVENGKYLDCKIAFDNSVKENDLKVFMWDSLGGMTSLCERAE